jgi:hypothetical protein
LREKRIRWKNGKKKKRRERIRSKDKVVPEHHPMEAYWGVEVQLHTFLTSALDGGEWSTSRLGCFDPRERAPGTHWIGSWVGPRAGLDAVEKGKIPSPRQESNKETKM